MECFITFIIIFIIIYLFLKLIDYIVLKHNGDIYMQSNLNYVIKTYNLNMNEKRYKILANIMTIINSLIISLISTIFIYLKINFIFQLFITFVLSIGLILGLYNLVGKILKKKGW